MKKIFYILAAAIVALGTVACENEGLDNINPNINVDGDTVSFVAGINRTDLDGTATVWDAEDIIVVTWNDVPYEFTNVGQEDKNTFSCTAEGLSAIVNAESIKAVYSNKKDGKVDSAAGVAGALLEYEGAFGNIAFEVKNAFLKFTVADPVTLTASEGLFGGDLTELTFEEAGVHYVAVNAGVEATLEYKVGESMGKNLKTTFEAKKIYNLGNLTKSIAGDSNGKYYTELATAFKLAESGATITLFEDIALEGLTEGALMKVDKNLTLNVGEHTLTATLPTATKNASIFTVTKGAEFTLVGAGNIVIENGGGIGQIGNHFISNEGGIVNLDMDGGIELNVVGTPFVNCIVDNNSTVGAATLNVKKGTYKQNSGNIFRSFVNHATELATINISGGSIIGTGEKAIYIWNQKMGKTTGILNITAGTFEKVQIDNDDKTLNQVTFTAEGYQLQQNANGYFDIVEKTPVAGDDKGNFYTELADAFTLAESGATITLSSDITSTEQIVVPADKEFVLDLGGCTIDGQIGSVEAPANTNLGIFYISAGAKLTVKNGNINATIHSDYDGVNWSYGWNSAIFFNQQGELIIESGNYTISSESDGMIVCVVDNMSNWSNLNTVTTIKGGTFTYEKANGVIIRNRSNNPSDYTGKAIVNIEGGTFNGNDSRIWYHQTSNTNNGYINISGGVFNSVRFTNSNSKFTSRETWGNYNITGGTFNINTVKQLDQLSEAVCNAVSYKGATVALSDNIDYKNGEFKAIGGVEISLDGTGFNTKGYFHMFRGTFDGKGKTISNMTIVAADNFDSFGLFGGLSTGAVVKDVTLDNITINSTHYAGALAGWIGTADADCEISGITVKNSNITVAPEVVGGGYDNGDKAGGVVGYMVAGEIKDCVVTGTKINGYRDLGGIVGYGRNIEAANNEVDGTVVITVNNEQNYKNYEVQEDYSVDNYVGDFDTTCTLSSNSGDATIVWGDIPATLVTYVAQVGEDKYETFEAALAAAEAGSTIELLANVEGEYTIEKACTIVTNGKTITVKAGTDFNMAFADGKYTFTAKVYVAQVGGTKYESFAEAYAAGTEITLLANVGNVIISKACVINAGTYNINITPDTGYGIMESSDNIYRIAKLSEWEISDGTRFYETETADLFVIKNVTLTANNFCLHKVGDTGWGAGAKYGLVNAGTKQVDTAIGLYSANWAGDITISNAKTVAHDIYFDKANSRLYVLTVGKTPANIVAPTSTTSYNIAGTMNSWGSGTKFNYAGDDVWHLVIELALNAEFKVQKNGSWSDGQNWGYSGIQSGVGRNLFSDKGGNAKAKAKATYEIWVIPSHNDAPLYIIKK